MRPGDIHVITEADVGHMGPFGKVTEMQIGNVVTRLDVGWSEETPEIHSALRKARGHSPGEVEYMSTRDRILRKHDPDHRWSLFYSSMSPAEIEDAHRKLDAALELGERAVKAGTPPSKAFSQYVLPTMKSLSGTGANDTEPRWYAMERLEIAEENADWGEKPQPSDRYAE